MGLTAVVPVPHTVIHNRPTPGWGTGRATLVHRVNEPQRLGVTLATNYKPPSLRYPAISVATLPTRWSADADPLPHLRLGPRIQTPGTPVLFAPACQRTTSRFHGQNASELEDAPLVNPSRLPAGDHRAAVWALLPRVGVTNMWNAFSPERAACAERSKRCGHKETRTLLLTSATCTIAKRDAILRPCPLTAFGASGDR